MLILRVQYLKADFVMKEQIVLIVAQRKSAAIQVRGQPLFSLLSYSAAVRRASARVFYFPALVYTCA